jgi:hypothetical protein
MHAFKSQSKFQFDVNSKKVNMSDRQHAAESIQQISIEFRQFWRQNKSPSHQRSDQNAGLVPNREPL